MRGGAAGVPEAWYDDRHNLATLARYMGERGDTVEDVAYMLEKPQKFEDDWLQCANTVVIGRCRTCEDNGYHCYPVSDLPLIACPGEVCATCDYRAGEQEVSPV